MQPTCYSRPCEPWATNHATTNSTRCGSACLGVSGLLQRATGRFFCGMGFISCRWGFIPRAFLANPAAFGINPAPPTHFPAPRGMNPVRRKALLEPCGVNPKSQKNHPAPQKKSSQTPKNQPKPRKTHPVARGKNPKSRGKRRFSLMEAVLARNPQFEGASRPFPRTAPPSACSFIIAEREFRRCASEFPAEECRNGFRRIALIAKWSGK